MHIRASALSGLFCAVLALVVNAQEAFRPPAVPLVTCDPYFSVWSPADGLAEAPTTHWTGRPHRLAALVRIDGRAFRLMGAEPQTLEALPQVSVKVLPTRTIYEFNGQGVTVTLRFTTPALPSDLSILSRPTTYVNCEVVSVDDKSHQVEFYFEARGELATDQPDQKVTGSVEKLNSAVALKLGASRQRVLGRSGDDLRIEWGYLYVAANKSAKPSAAFGPALEMRQAFDQRGTAGLQESQINFPLAAQDVAAAVAMSLGDVGKQKSSCYALIAYDDLYSIEYMKNPLRPYWRKDGWEAADLIAAAVTEHDALEQQCLEFDAELMADLKQVGGEEYAQIGALAFRQCFAAGKFVADANGQPLQFSKENHSNGCIATSDVFYPMAPQFLLFGPTLTKSFLVPFMEYAASDRWRFPFAPHDLGTYPKANGQRYGGGETNEADQMPVEECGNLLLLFGALARMEGNADFATRYWKQLSQWANYLRDKGFDPENQLCTDDFAGHMAHNVNLSAKAICGLGAYAQLCEMRGLKDEAALYRQTAQQFVTKWIAAADDGDHYRLAFDKAGSWSQKYNLVWDRVLELNLFPDEVYQKEMAFYLQTQREYGLPLDNRSDYTKLDWILWTATLTEKPDDFAALVTPVYRFLHKTPDRSPMTDWYFTSTAKKTGFTARPVVGGVFLRLLYDQQLWKKYASQDKTRSTGWATMPVPPKTLALVKVGSTDNAACRYTTTKPAYDWYAQDFPDDKWTGGRGGLGTRETPQAKVGTEWNTSDLWMRRTVKLSELPPRVGIRLWHDEAVEIYINGQPVLELDGYTTDYELIEIPAASLKVGDNVIAIHCHQTTGGQYLDFGFDAIVPAGK